MNLADVPRASAPLLAVAGWVLCGVAVTMLIGDSLGGSGPSAATTWGYILGSIGLACHAAAIGVSLWSWRHGGGAPVVALSYLALPIGWAAWTGYSRYAEAKYYRDDPDVFTAEPAGDGLDVRDARGVWHVPLATCPNTLGPRDGLGTRSQGRVIEVLDPDDTPFMRLYVAERRVECVAR